jgi:hypothetical protein
LFADVLHSCIVAEDAECVVALSIWLFKNFASVYFNGYCVFKDLA